MDIKPIYVTKAFMPPLEEYVKELEPIWRSAWITNNGELHDKLEHQLQDYLSVRNLTLFANGHLALSVAIRTLGLTGEVITTPYTFASTTHAIVENGLTPVFCDINEDDFTIDELKIERLITEKTSAILPVHVYGKACNVDFIDNLARKFNLKVIYDAAHAFGVTINGIGIGNYGDCSMFSFHATKLYHTGEGGALTYTDTRLKREFSLKKNFGIISPEEVQNIGINAKMSELHAAMGIVNLRYISELIEKRKLISDQYSELLSVIPGIKVTSNQPSVASNYSYYPIIVNEFEYGKTRDQLFDVLAVNDIHVRKYFFPLTSDFQCYRNQFDSNKTPMAKYISDRVLTLPLSAELESCEVERICKIIKDCRLV